MDKVSTTYNGKTNIADLTELTFTGVKHHNIQKALEVGFIIWGNMLRAEKGKPPLLPNGLTVEQDKAAKQLAETNRKIALIEAEIARLESERNIDLGNGLTLLKP